MKTKRSYLIFKLIIFIILLLSCDASKDKADKPDYPREFTASRSGKEKSIDMTQFIKTELDIPYAGNKNPRQTLDIIYPRTANPPYKMIMVFHGGGLMTGNKQAESIAPIFQAASQGYAVVSVNYRLSDEVTWPEPLYDAKAAVRFIRANRGKYRLDTQNIVVWGVSAGAHIAEMLAATNNRPAFENLAAGNGDSSSSVQGVVSWYGVSDISTLTGSVIFYADKIMGFDVRKNMEKARSASPVELVTDQYPPILLVHGTKDEIVPFQQSSDMAKKINKATGKQTARLMPFIGAFHGDPVIMTNDSIDECLNFIDGIEYKRKNPYRNKKYVIIKTR